MVPYITLLVSTNVLPSGEMSAPVIQKRGSVATCSANTVTCHVSH